MSKEVCLSGWVKKIHRSVEKKLGLKLNRFNYTV
jgi:hypothetical protein